MLKTNHAWVGGADSTAAKYAAALRRGRNCLSQLLKWLKRAVAQASKSCEQSDPSTAKKWED